MKHTPDLSNTAWRKSSYSDGGANNCVEVADGLPGLVPMRDSKVREGECWSSGRCRGGVRGQAEGIANRADRGATVRACPYDQQGCP